MVLNRYLTPGAEQIQTPTKAWDLLARTWLDAVMSVVSTRSNPKSSYLNLIQTLKVAGLFFSKKKCPIHAQKYACRMLPTTNRRFDMGNLYFSAGRKESTMRIKASTLIDVPRRWRRRQIGLLCSPKSKQIIRRIAVFSRVSRAYSRDRNLWSYYNQ